MADSDSEQPVPSIPSEVTPKLSDQIIESYATSRYDPEEKQFLPAGYIGTLVTLEAIVQELDEKDILEPEDLNLDLPGNRMKKKIVDFVYQQAKKLFAISVVSGLHGHDLALAMNRFRTLKVCDASLPLTESVLGDSSSNLAIKEFVIPVNNEELWKDADEVWNSEVNTLNEISDLKHPHLIQRIAAIIRGNQRFLMFLWADGGNLRDYWEHNPKPNLTADLVKDIIEQIRGMAEALEKLHGYRDQYHYRHGDIKPENILNFPDPKKSRMGTFKISDLGSAKHHSVATRLRERTGGKAYATQAYQPPESVTNQLSSSSRLYDIWSMGCVTLEFMVWVLYGYEELKKFTTSIKGKLDEPCAFFEVEKIEYQNTPPGLVASIHPAVQACLDRLSADPECAKDTALGDLLEIIKNDLLVVVGQDFLRPELYRKLLLKKVFLRVYPQAGDHNVVKRVRHLYRTPIKMYV
ncbi:putative ALK tyrosine kinase receptor [Glarea lozoyensis 74030]|uniref:Putative ALK tyrosine kinase receptor n=1 Tax=Glarea lozoyensis (strain ATCC 74030 / MF5533) TaxID=1104152 RepID=H0EET8_GLAL7|nr:putative ALK tyrosine kinase receptor [Glarea lozoyensis 74030]